MSVVRRWLLVSFLIVFSVFGAVWLLMVRFEIESRYDGINFNISPLVGNLFLLSTGQWGEVRKVKFVLTPEEQALFRTFKSLEDRSSVAYSMDVLKNGLNIEIIANYSIDFLRQELSEKDKLDRSLLNYLCLTIKDTDDASACLNQIKRFIGWKNKLGLGEFIKISKKRDLSLIKKVYAACSGTIQCGVIGCYCSSGGRACDQVGSSCDFGAGTCQCGVCEGSSGTLQCSILSDPDVCESAHPADCGVGKCILADFPCSWCTPGTCGNFGNCSVVSDLCVKSGDDGCGTSCWDYCLTTCDGNTSGNCPTDCGLDARTLEGSQICSGDGSDCTTINCPATAPCCTESDPNAPVLSAPASGTIVNVNSAVTLDWDAISNWGTGCPSNSNRYEVCVMSDSTCNLLNWVDVGTTTYRVWTPTTGDSVVTWKVRSNNGSGTATSSTRTLCIEDQLCSAPQCGETKGCGGNCPDTDSGVPGTPTVNSPWRGGNNNNEFGLPNNWWIES
jgi:hypothetical protein